MASRSITTTKNYRLFKLSGENRPLQLAKHKKLKESMQKYGFLRSFPLSCVRDNDGNIVVKDGQHRLAFAEELGLQVHYVVEEKDYDVATVNCTAKTWTLRDYAQKYSADGIAVYQDGLEFAEEHGIPVGTAFALLAGTTTFQNVKNAFESGEFKAKDRHYADMVASTYAAIAKMSKAVKCARFLEACMAVCRVKDFDPSRLIGSCNRCRDKLVSYSTRDAYLEMIEEIYNYNRRQLAPLKIEALQAMKDRNAVNAKVAAKKKRQAVAA